MARAKVLLIDDDRLQFLVTQGLFHNFRADQFELEWAGTYEQGLERLLSGVYVACLLDFQLGPRDGLQLIREAVEQQCPTPIVFLTAESSENVDMQALEAGALDYLIKGEITPGMLERSLRYAVKLGDSLRRLKELAIRDELTGLLNRRAFELALAEEMDRARRFQRTLGLILIDLDHFKRVNDTHGHLAGDAVLKEVALRIGVGVRTVDRVARFGGEELAVIVAEANIDATHDLARRLVSRVAASPIKLSEALEVGVTISAGVAAFPRDGTTRENLLEACDRALYLAKSAGRNRAELSLG